MSRASPSDNIHTDVDRLSQSSMDRSKPAEIDSLVHKHDIKPPPRRNLKQHRQRYSNRYARLEFLKQLKKRPPIRTTKKAYEVTG